MNYPSCVRKKKSKIIAWNPKLNSRRRYNLDIGGKMHFYGGAHKDVMSKVVQKVLELKLT
jgi:hypothetical protein